MEQPIVALCQPLYGYISADAHLRQMAWSNVNCHTNYHWYRDTSGTLRCTAQKDLPGLPGPDAPVEVRPLLCGYFGRSKGYIDWARNDCVESVLSRFPSCSHIFFQDQDTDAPDMAIRDLLLADKDVISGIYFKKEDSAGPVGYASLDPPVALDEFNEDGLQQVAGIGFGCALVRTSVFLKMYEHFGDTEWFKVQRQAGQCRGEDFWFSARCAEMGIPIYIDGRVRCEHIGDKAWTIDDYRRAKGRSGADAIQGWMLPAELIWLREQATQCETIIEIGSWKGRSTYSLASGVRGMVYAVDHWMGSENAIDDTHAPTRTASGRQAVKSEFQRNMKEFLEAGKLCIVDAPSHVAVRQLPRNVDMVFIDGDHAFESVVADIKNYLPLLKDGGLICGHDYTIDTVRSAVDQLIPGRQTGPDSLWWARTNWQGVKK